MKASNLSSASRRINPKFSIALGFCLLAFNFVSAQGIPSSIGGLALTASTNNPTPGQQVKITAASYGTDIDSATLTWTVSGKIAQQGIGLTTLSVNAPAVGKTVTVSVTAVAQNGVTISNSISIGSGSIDLIMEPDGYVPPFFPGKLPLSYQNTVRVIAVPHLADSSGKEYDPKNLVYQWKKDSGTVLQDQSGYGKQSIEIVGDVIPRPYYLIVDASTRDGSAKAEGIVQVNPQSPSLSFYTSDPLYGTLFNKALGGLITIGSQKETSVLAVPYGFSKPVNKMGNLSLTWIINGTEHPELSSSDSVILRAPDNAGGSSQIELEIKNTANILQSADASFSAVFSPGNQTPATLIFGIPVAYAADTSGDYTLLAPLPCIESPAKTDPSTGKQIPGVTCKGGNGTLQPSVNFKSYMQYFFNLIIALASVAAVFMIVWGGFKYVTTASSQEKSAGLKTFTNAIYGLLLILCSYIILRTINPKLVEIDLSGVTPLLKVAPSAWKNYYDTVQPYLSNLTREKVIENEQLNAQITKDQQTIQDLKSQRGALLYDEGVPDTDQRVRDLDLQINQLSQSIQDNQNKVALNIFNGSSDKTIGNLSDPNTKPSDALVAARVIQDLYNKTSLPVSDPTTIMSLAQKRDDDMLAAIKSYTNTLPAKSISNNSEELNGINALRDTYLPIDPAKRAEAQFYLDNAVVTKNVGTISGSVLDNMVNSIKNSQSYQDGLKKYGK